MPDIAIETAQHVNINQRPAGLLPRIGATLIDFSLLGGTLLLLLLLSVPLFSEGAGEIFLIIILLIFSLYHLFCELFLNGRSVGKLTLHLRVVRIDGQRLTFWDCLLRWVLRVIDISGTMGTGAIISILLTSKMQRIGDLAAGTTVIIEKQATSLQQIVSYDTPEDYSVTFPQAILLSDKDIAIIREIWKEHQKSKDNTLLEPLALKIKSLTGIETPMDDQLFVPTLLRDYNHLTK